MARFGSVASALVMGVCIVAIASPADAQTRQFNIPAGSLRSALDRFVAETGMQLIYKSDELGGARTKGVTGSLSREAALARILSGSGFGLRRDASGASAIVRNGAAGQAPVGNGAAETVASPSDKADASLAAGEDEDQGGGDEEAATDTIVITGSRIRGAPPAAPVIAVSREDMITAGQRDLGEVLRSLSQNFSGGQNPGIAADSLPDSLDLTGGSNANLRGLGPSATLTLLNGRRMAYGGINQGVDISTIPLGAVERIEVVADGSSALYGSDAVGGVVNILLRREFDGFEGSALIGGATSGGYDRSQLSLTAGQTWTGGSFLVAGQYDRWSDIVAGQRSYTAAQFPTATLFPRQHIWSGIARASQSLGPDVTIDFDGYYSNRSTGREQPSTVTADATFSGSVTERENESFYVSPRLTWFLGGGWISSLSGTHGEDFIDSFQVNSFNGAVFLRGITQYRNRTSVAEVNAEGPLFQLPAGSVRLAIGGGHRTVGLTRYSQSNNAAPLDSRWSQDSYYGYGELFVPLVSPSLAIPAVRSLSFSAALRYEDYSGVGGVGTPKLGVVYSPTRDLTLSATWGKSFKAATLWERFQGTNLALSLATARGGTGFPAGSTALLLSGGNPSLDPERSTNWTTTLAIHPVALDGVKLEVSYFNVNYRERLLAPIAVLNQALANPVYADFVNLNPTVDEVNAAVGLGDFPLNNFSGGPLNPANVVAIIDNRVTNIARQRASGVDVSTSYNFDFSDDDKLTASGSVTYLRLRNQVLPTSPLIPASGVLFTPAEWRARASLVWAHGPLTLASYLNYTGALDDLRLASPEDGISSQATVDATASYRLPIGDGRRAVKAQLSVSNILNTDPKRIWVNNPRATPYESVNYSAIGRQATLSVAISW